MWVLLWPNAVRMASNDLKTWVSDKLMVLLGYSQITLVNYVIVKGKFDASSLWSLWSTFFFLLLSDNLQLGLLQLNNQNHQLNLLECWWITDLLLLVILVPLRKRFLLEFLIKLLLWMWVFFEVKCGLLFFFSERSMYGCKQRQFWLVFLIFFICSSVSFTNNGKQRQQC